jgi:hypothetical protein
LADIGDHINFELWTALDMEQMHRDVAKTFNSPPQFQKHHGHSDYAPNFAEGLELLRNLEDIGKLLSCIDALIGIDTQS